EPLGAQHPNDVAVRMGLWMTYWTTSSVYEEQDDALAHGYALKALKTVQETVDKDPLNVRAKQQLAKSFSQLGQTAINTGRRVEAIRYLEKSCEILRGVIGAESKNNKLKTELASALTRLGQAKAGHGSPQAALADLEKGAEMYREVAVNSAGDNRTSRNLANSHRLIAETYEKIASAERGKKGLAARQMAKSNYQTALDILSRLQGQIVLSEYDRKLLGELQAILRRYER
ncbi:MAG TPA: tetratricopeptide repeat protein, partial [Pyrinomonadaceae bacterium]|nr:tetratricopeptide repeat protein [Pyrinomonadaceae bacterium]